MLPPLSVLLRIATAWVGRYYFDGGSGTGNPTFLEALYFASASITTVVYGDLTTETEAGRCLNAFYLFISTIAFVHAVSTIARVPFDRRKALQEQRVMNQFGKDLDFNELNALCRGGAIEGSCTKTEFTLRMLCWLDRVSAEDIAMCEEKFDELDKSGDGLLNVSDVVRSTWQRGAAKAYISSLGNFTRTSVPEFVSEPQNEAGTASPELPPPAPGSTPSPVARLVVDSSAAPGSINL